MIGKTGDDRRKSIRFPMNLEAQLKATGLNAAGTTVNVSSGGALLMTKAPIARGTVLEAHVKWPAGLESCDLKLVLAGEVVWTRGNLIALSLRDYQFRTVSRKREPAQQTHSFAQARGAG